MHKLMARGTILEHELSELRLLVERQTGSLLDCPNNALAAHLANYLEGQQLESAALLLDRLRSSDQDPGLIPEFLSGLLDTSTGFFRHPGAMNAFARQVLPQLGLRKSAEGGQVRIWSAGCSTGEEAYSIAMAVCNTATGASSNVVNGFPGIGSITKEKSNSARKTATVQASQPAKPQSAQNTKDLAVQVVGSDLLPSSIQVAERGLYPQSALAGLPAAAIRSCFSRIAAASRVRGAENSTYGNAARNLNDTDDKNNEPPEELDSGYSFGGGSRPEPAVIGPDISPATHLLVKARLRSMVTFNVMNLVRPVYIGRFDCIFCMDVLPSLSRTQRTALLERLHLYLEPGGYLFLSQSEKLSAPNLNFRSETFDGYTFHRKPLAASAAYGR